MRQAVDCLRGEEPGELPHMAELPHISCQAQNKMPNGGQVFLRGCVRLRLQA